MDETVYAFIKDAARIALGVSNRAIFTNIIIQVEAVVALELSILTNRIIKALITSTILLIVISFTNTGSPKKYKIWFTVNDFTIGTTDGINDWTTNTLIIF